MPPIVTSIASAILLLIQLGRGSVDVVKAAQDMITAFFRKKLISKDEQNFLFGFVTTVTESALAGQFPSHWIPRPNPVDEPETTTDEPGS